MYQDKPPIEAFMHYEVDDALCFVSEDDEFLAHYGIKRRSGRYPWGSGKDPYQHSGDFLARVEQLQKEGMNEKQIADTIGISTTELRLQKRLATHERRRLLADRAQSLRDDGKSLNEIAEIMGFKNDSSVRSLLNQSTADSKNKARTSAEVLKKELAEKGMIDVGAGAERELGISQQKLEEALRILELEGYKVYGVGIPQVTNPGKQSNTAVLCPPGTEYKYVYDHMGDIQPVGNYTSKDGGKTFQQLQYPASLDSSRIGIRYGDEGGASKDGVIELRRGVADLDMGNSHYAQVRILVDGTHYLKGMAMYSDDIPDGVDIMFNTNKKSGTAKMDVLKKIKEDPDNPFGAAIKANGQSNYIGTDGKEHLSPINKLKEEGDWDQMSKTLSSQFLSKQPIKLIKQQLGITYQDSVAEFDEIKSLTNPTIKRKMLMDFADECDSAVVHLKAAALPRQRTQVILPIDKLKDTEIYAPNYRDGEQVALVRYPHAGIFEIPILTVNNKNPAGKSILGNVRDAVGINSKVAEQLSGADFDGDTVTVIPTGNGVKIKNKRPLEGLKGFDPKEKYSTEGKTGVKLMSEGQKQKQMGVVSNLITDMTLGGAPEQEIVRAVKHSMVVIDAVKHKLDYKQSEKDNGIEELKQKWQKRVDEDGNVKYGGASTLLSRRKQGIQVPERKGSAIVDPDTGKVSYKTTGRTYVDKKTGKTVQAMDKSKLLLETEDLRTLSTGTLEENAYADYGNKMKALANEARKEYKATGRLKYNSSAKQTYSTEVASLNAKLNVAAKNAPKERRAQAVANSVVKAKMQDNPDMDKKEIKKARQQAITKARNEVGASGKDSRITITPKEWDAIQAGAISDSKLMDILRYSDPDVVKQMAMPKTTTQLSTAKVNKIKSMSAMGYTNAEIADLMHVSTSTIGKYIAGKKEGEQ